MNETKFRLGIGGVVAYRWEDCDRATVSRRYDRLAGLIPFFERLLFLPANLREQAVDHLDLRRGDRVLEIGCGTGRNFAALRAAVGAAGTIYGVDISPGMLRKAREMRATQHWRNIELFECDAAEFTAPTPLDGVLFGLSYNTMPHHLAVLQRAWRQLRPGGRLVIMDAKLPPGRSGQFILPFTLWLMKHTLLGNPLIRPWEELAGVTEHFTMKEYLFGSYYICRGSKPVASTQPVRRKGILHGHHDTVARPIAAE